VKGFDKDQQVVVIVLGVVFLSLFLLRTYSFPIWPFQSKQQGQCEPCKRIIIEVTGKVKHPGVYIFKETPSIEDAIYAAGGLLNGLCLVPDLKHQVLKNGSHVLITEGEYAKAVLKILNISPRKRLILGLPVNINYVSPEDLALVPGINLGLARRIVTYRERHGSFKTWEDLLPVKGIGPKNLKRLKLYSSLD